MSVWCSPWQAHTSLESEVYDQGLDVNGQGSEGHSTRPPGSAHFPGAPPTAQLFARLSAHCVSHTGILFPGQESLILPE